ncbi:SAM-dependent methyltransferase [Brevibacterium salitolerans]|jgi:methyltransferase (TIGR00027 family)|uniref:S-adenosyl-L-methionine-dependent methyltransferase n=1 Tax=Brevibacterium salitolerans TaxID=1403566 RepID=A0ABP5IVD9_9MICO
MLKHSAGADQLLIVGAGLDTTHLRLPARSRTHTWTLDKPGVLAWRQQVFAEAEVGDSTTHIPLDLTDGLGAGDLQGCGLDLEAPVVIVWLGVSMYLDPHDLRQFLADLAGLAPGSTLIFDYHLGKNRRDEAGNAYASAVASTAGRGGEPWRTAASPHQMHSWLNAAGWHVDDDRDEADAAPYEFWKRQPHLRPMELVRLVTAHLAH